MPAVAELYEVKKIFETEEIETHALNDITFTIEQEDYVSISGPSGCGKSTLLSILGLLDSISGGDFLIGGVNSSKLTRRQRANTRNKKIGFIFQSFNLISDLTVDENVMLPLTYRNDFRKHELGNMVTSALKKVEMLHRAKHFPSQLSGGQQQRVAIARAIVGNPSLLLADEPTGNLDSKNALSVMDIFDQLHGDGATICMVTHDPLSAARALRQIEMLDGQIVNDSSIQRKERLA